MSDSIIELRDVYYTYPDGTSALENVTLTVKKGERLAIVGPNGAGKSTLLLAIAGLIPITKGYLSVEGRKIEKSAVESANELIWLRRKLGIVFQDSDVALFNSTVWGDVTFGPLHMDLTKDEVTRRASSALQLLGISHLKNRAPFRLSGGEKRKVSIASVLSIDPEIILFDEPTSDLDPKSRKNVIEILKRLSSEGKTIIVATHDVNAVPEIAERMVVIKKKVLASGNVREIMSNEVLLEEAGLEVPDITLLFKILRSLGVYTEELPYSVHDATRTILKK